MPVLTSILVADGSSDRALLPLITRALGLIAPNVQFAEIANPGVSNGSLSERVSECIADYPCDLLFVHRDSESQEPRLRFDEIAAAVAGLSAKTIAIVPVKMSEAWLVTDEGAIRRAVGNPNGREELNLPPLNRVESIDAKKILDAAIVSAAFNNGTRRRQKFRPERYRFRVAEELPDIARLRLVSSYAEFETRLRQTLAQLIGS